jgi:hypothetical protein
VLKHGEANPLAVFGLRELDYCPSHFTTVDFDLTSNTKAISDWIGTNLTGRFWYGDWYFKDEQGHVQTKKRAAFELAGEASMFALILDQINRYDFG